MRDADKKGQGVMLNDNDSSALLQYAMQLVGTQQCAADHDERRAAELRRPCMLLRPKLFQDGNAWCALFGEDIAVGVCGWGESPAAAYLDFDRAWVAPARTSPPPSIGDQPGTTETTE